MARIVEKYASFQGLYTKIKQIFNLPCSELNKIKFLYLKQYRILDSDLNSENDKKYCQNKKSIELSGMKTNHEDVNCGG